MLVSDSFTSAGNTAVGNVSPSYGHGSHGGVVQTSQDQAEDVFAPTNLSADTRDSMTISHQTVARSIGSTISLALVTPSAAGTYTVSVYTQTSSSGATPAAATPTVTWTVTVTAPVRTATAASTSTLRAGEFASATAAPFSGTAEGTDSSVITAATSLATDT